MKLSYLSVPLDSYSLCLLPNFLPATTLLACSSLRSSESQKRTLRKLSVNHDGYNQLRLRTILRERHTKKFTYIPYQSGYVYVPALLISFFKF